MNTKFLRLGILMAIAAALLTGCVTFSGTDLFGNTVRGSGVAAQEERAVSDFDEVSMDGIGYLEITKGDANQLIVEADDNILPYLTTEVRNGRLLIGTEPRTNLLPDEPIRFYLTIASEGLDQIELNGSGDIYAAKLTQPELTVEIDGSGDIEIDNLEADRLTVQLDGSGNINLSGQVTEQEVDINGSGNYSADDLQSEQGSVSIDGSGDAVVWSVGSLEVDIGGSGSVSYYGSPNLNQNISGSGEIQNLGDR